MTLDPRKLSDQLAPFYRAPTMPKTDAAGQWARAIAVYSQDATAGPLALASPLVVPITSGDYLSSLDGALRGMWQEAVWLAPGFTGVTLLVPPLGPFLLSLQPQLIRERDPRVALQAVVQSIHTYTMAITVTVTNLTSGVTAVSPIV